jgi:hypothetical protein
MSWTEMYQKLPEKENAVLSEQFLRDNNFQDATDFVAKNSAGVELPPLIMDKWNCELLDHVRPIKWLDPEIDGKYNLVAIGSGAGGLASAGGCGWLGGKAAIIEKSMFGGDCLNTGCVPSKALLKIGKLVYDTRVNFLVQ